MIFTIDFDGTCVDHRYPKVGPDLPHAVDVMQEMIERKHRIILLTMRSNFKIKDLDAAVSWFDEREIPLMGVNENPEQRTWTSSPKPHADFNIDDKNLGCPLIKLSWMERPGVDWKSVRGLLHKTFEY